MVFSLLFSLVSSLVFSLNDEFWLIAPHAEQAAVAEHCVDAQQPRRPLRSVLSAVAVGPALSLAHQPEPLASAVVPAVLTSAPPPRDPQASVVLSAGLADTVQVLAQVSWSALDARYPGLSRSSYRATGSAGNSYLVNAVRVDLRTTGLRLATTARMSPWVDGSSETMTRKASQWIADSQATSEKLALAINTDAFNLTSGSQSVAANLRGFAVADGTLVSSGNKGGNAATLFWDPITGARAEYTSFGSANTQALTAGEVAVSGFSFALDDGVIASSDQLLAARSGLGLSQDGSFLYLMTIDKKTGKEKSDGATIAQVGQELFNLGAYDGINLDGGGSTQMAWWNPASASVQMLGGSDSRYVGQHLGIYYQAVV